MKHTVSEVILKNGAQGLFIDVPGAEVTNFELNFRSGEYLVPKKKWEVPHIMEHVVWGGANEDFPDRQIFQAEVGKNGAYTNAYTSYYYVAYVGEIADFECDRVLELSFKSLSKPLFLQQEFDAEIGNIRDELTSYTNNHFRELGSEMSKAYGFNTVTDRERIGLMSNVSRQDLVDHYKKTHFTKNLRFIIAGSLRGRRAVLKKMLENAELPKGQSQHKLPSDKAIQPAKPVFIPNSTVPNIYLILNSHYNDVITVEEDDALSLARTMLTETLYSNIFGQARDQGLVYHVSSGHQMSSRTTEWWLSTQVLAENAPALCEIILKEVKKIQKCLITDSDLEGAKHYALGSFQRSFQTVGSIASAYSRYFFDGHIEDMRSVPARLKAVTKQDIADAMNKMFSQKLGGVGVLGGEDDAISGKLQNQLQSLWN